jgi:curved DNA-binding protein
MSKDYYQVLGIPKTAKSEEIKKAYRKLAMQYHPDKNPGKEQWANNKFKEINEAYAVLGDPEKRKQYDQYGTTGNAGDIFGSKYTSTTFDDLMKEFGGAGLGFDFLNNIFGDMLKNRGFSYRVYTSGGRPGGGRAGTGGMGNLEELLRRAQQPQKENVKYAITITKEQAKAGMEKDLVRRGKKLRVKIPAGIKSGALIKLRNARKITDRSPGDILIEVNIK